MGNSLFQAYLDESGTHEGSPILAVAGYFGTEAQWQIFLDNWTHKEFHATERRYEVLKPQLANAIDVATLHGVEVCLRPWEFKTHASASFKSSIGNAYAVSAYVCATSICGLISSDPEARVAFILEDGQPNVRWVQRLLLAMMRNMPIASVTVARKQDFTQLHTADFLAHSRSTTDKPWMDRLFARKRVWEQRIEKDIFEDTSIEAARLAVAHRRRKKAEQGTRRNVRKMAKYRP